jgi:hypothetical protein
MIPFEGPLAGAQQTCPHDDAWPNDAECKISAYSPLRYRSRIVVIRTALKGS